MDISVLKNFISIILCISLITFSALADKNRELWEAVKTGDANTVKQLLKDGASPNTKTLHYPQHSVLALSVELGNWEIMEALIENGARLQDVTCDGKSILHIAAKKQSAKMLAYLKNHGVDENIKDSSNSLALYYAALNHNISASLFLLKNNNALGVCLEKLTEKSEEKILRRKASYAIPISRDYRFYTLPASKSYLPDAAITYLQMKYPGIRRKDRSSYNSNDFPFIEYYQKNICKPTDAAKRAKSALMFLDTIRIEEISENHEMWDKGKGNVESYRNIQRLNYTDKTKRLINSDLGQHWFNIQFLRAGYLFMATSEMSKKPLNGSQGGTHYDNGIVDYTYKREIVIPASIYNGFEITIANIEFRNLILHGGKIRIGYPSSSSNALHIKKYSGHTVDADTLYTTAMKSNMKYFGFGLGAGYRLRFTNSLSVSGEISYLLGTINDGYGSRSSSSYINGIDTYEWNVRVHSLPISIGVQFDLKKYFPIHGTFGYDPLTKSVNSTLSIGIKLLGDGFLLDKLSGKRVRYCTN